MSDDGEELADEVDVEDARIVVGKRKARVIDIRSEEDYAEERIFGSARADPDDVGERLAELEDDDEEIEMVLLVCDDGSRSSELAEELRGDGHKVSSLDGGFSAWIGDHLPTAPGRDEEYEGPEVKIPGAVASEGEPDEDEDEDEGEAGTGEAESDAEGERAEPRAEETADEEKAERAEEA